MCLGSSEDLSDSLLARVLRSWKLDARDHGVAFALEAHRILICACNETREICRSNVRQLINQVPWLKVAGIALCRPRFWLSGAWRLAQVQSSNRERVTLVALSARQHWSHSSFARRAFPSPIDSSSLSSIPNTPLTPPSPLSTRHPISHPSILLPYPSVSIKRPQS